MQKAYLMALSEKTAKDKSLMKNNILKKVIINFLVTFLFTFMLFLFGPSEIFFANVVEFDFVYGEFAICMAAFAVMGALILTAIGTFLPDIINRIFLSLIFGISVAGYMQVMFLNKNLDLLGVNPEGYQVGKGQTIVNLIIWIVIIAIVMFVAFWRKKIWHRLVTYLSVFLLSVQFVALISLLITGKEEAYKHPEGMYYLSGENQYQVSENENIIVIILDYFSNQYLDPLEKTYPGATDFLHDFTYYNNVDCTYYGTFPSLAHMLTGKEVDASLPINEWTKQIWEEDSTCNFYQMLHENNYIVNLYTPEACYLCGQNNPQILEGKISNVVNTSRDIVVNHKLLNRTLVKMSGYRMFPEIIKPYFYTSLSEYTNIVTQNLYGVKHYNYDFLKGLQEQGLTLDDTSNYFIVQHLMGPHEYTTDEKGGYKEKATREETTKGCMVIVEEYLNQLKKLGVYDKSTIIITADHGDTYESQVIFFIKEPYVTHNVFTSSNAPISLCEFLPTIAEIIGEDYSEYGQSIYDFAQDEERTRTVWVRKYDPEFPTVPSYTGLKDGQSNVYYGYSYIGDIDDLILQTEQGPSLKMQMADSFW